MGTWANWLREQTLRLLTAPQPGLPLAKVALATAAILPATETKAEPLILHRLLRRPIGHLVTNWPHQTSYFSYTIIRKIPGKPSKSTAMAWVRSLVGELRSPQTVWRSKKKKKQVWLEKCTNKCNLNRYCQLFYKKALILPISTNNIWESPPHILANTRHYHFKNFLKNRFKVISHSYFNLYFPDIVFLCVYWLLHFFLLWIICSYLLPNFLLVSYSLLP